MSANRSPTRSNGLQSCSRSDLQYCDSGAFLGGKPQNLAEVAIKRNQCSFFGVANLEEILVANPAQCLFRHGNRIVT
jgi:hypothetical protein